MTGTSTSGAEWKGAGEAKALGHIFGASVEHDDGEAPPNKVPATAVYVATQDEIDLATQTQIAADALKEAEGVEPLRVRAGIELLKLQQIFCRIDLARDAVIARMRDEGHTYAVVGAAVGLAAHAAACRYKAIKAKRPLGPSNAVRGRFLIWAAVEFGRKKGAISQYMTLARKPERQKRIRAIANSASKIGRAILEAQRRPGVAEPLRRAFQALPVPARERWLVWGASLLIGSDDPQTIARWFATRFTQ
jgi:hypothetical protein